jgi:hypothetical protein
VALKTDDNPIDKGKNILIPIPIVIGIIILTKGI